MSGKDWLCSLKKGDKVDVLDTAYHGTARYIWHIGTIQEINMISTGHEIQFHFFVSFDGWSSFHNKWISSKDIKDPNHSDHNSMQPLHSNTPYHHPMLEYCRIKPRFKKYHCTKCKRLCCDKCFIIHIYNQITRKLLDTQCIECYSKTQYKHKYTIIHLFFKSIFADKDTNIEINIISLITNYSVDAEITCGNDMGYSRCSKIIKLALPKDHKLGIRANSDFFSLSEITAKNNVIACFHCHHQHVEHGTFRCLLFHQKKFLKRCAHQYCQKEICCDCYDAYCDGVRCKDLHCKDCRLDIDQNVCNNCNSGFLCNSCYAEKSVCDECGKQICNSCRAICKMDNCFNKMKMCSKYLCAKCNDKMESDGNIFCYECSTIICTDCTMINKCVGNNCQRMLRLCVDCYNESIACSDCEEF